jgi:hypothetical protein
MSCIRLYPDGLYWCEPKSYFGKPESFLSEPELVLHDEAEADMQPVMSLDNSDNDEAEIPELVLPGEPLI